jgi:DNA-binding CsgD family transcriptional regulator
MAVTLAERDGALSAIRRLLSDAVDGNGGALFILGEAGLGKSALLDYALELAADRIIVGLGRADVAEAALPFGLISQALEPLLGAQALAPNDSGDQVYERAANRLYSVLHRFREVASTRPLLVALDDAHWADPDSLTLLRLMCRRISDLPVALLATARPWPAETARAAEELSQQGLAELQRLHPLSDQASISLLAERLGEGTCSPDLDGAVDSCAGNPLLLAHVAAELAAGQTLPDRAGGANGSWASRLLLSRFVAVGPAAEAYLRAASVLGGRFRPEVAADVAELSVADATRALEALVGAGLVADGGEGWATFSHQLVRLAVYDQAAPLRAHLHEAAFRVLLERRAPAAEAAEHAVVARMADPMALDVMVRAGREALERGAPGTARHHLGSVVNLAGDDAPPDVLRDLAEALRAIGENQKAADVCRQLLRRTDQRGPLYLLGLCELAQAEFRAGRVEEASATIEQAVRLAEDEPPELAAVVLVDQAHLSVLRLGPRAVLPLAGRARSVAAQVGGQVQALADAVWAQCAYLSGDPAGLDVARAAARSATGPVPEVTQWSDPRVLYAELCSWSERFEEAEQQLTALIAEAEEYRYPMNLFEGQSLLVGVLRRTARLVEADNVADQLLESAELMPFSLPLAYSEKALCLLDLGRLEEASQSYQQAMAATSGRASLGRVWTTQHFTRAVLAFRRGQMEEASRVFRQLERSARMVDLNEPCIYPWAAPAIAAHLACGRQDQVASVIEWLEPRAAALPSRWPKAVLAGGLAALAERHGDVAAAEEGFARAVDFHHPASSLARAEALMDQGGFLLRQGQPARARPVLAEALQLAESCGAAWHAEQARIRWRRAGGRTRTTRSGALTPQEQAVADLARAGRTNKEIASQLFLSVNTVETHLAHVFRKLGISRRWQLMATEESTVNR